VAFPQYRPRTKNRGPGRLRKMAGLPESCLCRQARLAAAGITWKEGGPPGVYWPIGRRRVGGGWLCAGRRGSRRTVGIGLTAVPAAAHCSSRPRPRRSLPCAASPPTIREIPPPGRAKNRPRKHLQPGPLRTRRGPPGPSTICNLVVELHHPGSLARVPSPGPLPSASGWAGPVKITVTVNGRPTTGAEPRPC